MKKLIYYFFHDLKLKNKFIIVNSILVLVPTVVLASFMYKNLSSIIEKSAIESEAALVMQTSETLSETVNRLSMTMDTACNNPTFINLVSSDDMVGYAESLRMSAEATSFFSNINTLVDGEFITAIKVYLPDDSQGKITSEDINRWFPHNDILDTESKITSAYWHGIFNGSPDITEILCPEFYLTQREKNEYGSVAYVKEYKNDFMEDVCIYVAIYVSRNYLDDVLTHALTGNGSVYYVINERDSLVASSDLSLSGMYMMNFDNIPKIIKGEGEFASGTISGNSVFMTYRDIPRTDWRLISVIPSANVTGRGSGVLMRAVYLYLIFFVIALVLAFTLSGNIAGRLSKIVRIMNEKRADQKPGIITGEKGKDEIGQFVDNYNDMIERINSLMEEQAIIAERLKVSEVNALQAQINPHFLYNMLDMINWLSKAGKKEQTSKAIQTLSSFYKLTLSKKEIFSTVGEELKHVGLYVELQNMRYEDKIDLLIDVPEELYDIRIPKLVFQPIVENSILHGIFETETKSGSIVITGWGDGDDAVFSVFDTGVGIDKEVLPLILTGESKGSGSNIGIYNTHLRLQLLYGEKYGLHFESEKGKGTEVLVSIKKEI